ncbi:FtsH protease activity modulator HflK [Serpentinimonas raichei]|nr:FtsH protease activity modulator HflK [Serpentinimonas raichei]
MHMTSSPLRFPWWSRVRGMFNLNDPRWGRDDDAKPGSSDGSRESGHRPDPSHDDRRGDEQQPDPRPWQGRPQGSGRGPKQGPPDLDEIWRDFNRKLNGLFGGARGGGGMGSGGSGGSGGGMPGFKAPTPKGAGVVAGMVGGVLLVLWLGSGFFIVQEGQQAVVTQFGRYHSTVGAGFNWRLPAPIQRHETVFVTTIRSVDVGREDIVAATGLRDAGMLTLDENIVEIRFAVQYRLNDARAFLFNSRDPDNAVLRAAETSVREVVGNMTMDQALVDERDQIAPRVRALMQSLLDRAQVGVEVVAVNLQQGGVRPPEQVQAAFDDVLVAGQERERARNEAEAYANDVIPRARGAAARLMEEAQGHKVRVVARAEGDAERFRLVQAEHARAPQVTRDRLYLETMQEVFSNVTKVLIDSRNNNNLLHLPLDRLIQQAAAASPLPTAPAAAAPAAPVAPVPALDPRAREAQRAR